MSIQTRHEQRIDLLTAFAREVANMDKELVSLISEFIVSMSILFLVFEGKTAGYVGVPVVAILMSVDFARILEAWRSAKLQADTQTES